MFELRNVCINISLLKEINDIPIYAKTVRELCTKKPGRQKREHSTIQVGGKLASLMSTRFVTKKYRDPRIPVVTTFINGHPIKNTLIDLGAAINVMTMDTLSHVGSFYLLPTTTMLELTDRSKVKPKGVLEDIVISLDSWEYPFQFYVLQPKTNLGGHPLIFGRPWLATADAYIGCRYGNMTITHGAETKHINLYPLAQPLLRSENTHWVEEEEHDSECTRPILTIAQAMSLKENSEENLINHCITNLDFL